MEIIDVFREVIHKVIIIIIIIIIIITVIINKNISVACRLFTNVSETFD